MFRTWTLRLAAALAVPCVSPTLRAADSSDDKLFNQVMSRLRSSKRHRLEVDDPQLFSSEGDEMTRPSRKEIADWSQMADEQVLKRELRRRLFRAILALPVIYRAPVLLRDVQGLSTEEASAVLRVKDQTLKSRLHRGRLILRKQLADFSSGLALHRQAA